MFVEFLEPASIELDDAVEYYNMQSVGLGENFLTEVGDNTINFSIP